MSIIRTWFRARNERQADQDADSWYWMDRGADRTIDAFNDERNERIVTDRDMFDTARGRCTIPGCRCGQ